MVKLYNDNKDKSLISWLEYDKTFTVKNTQGTTGLLKTKTEHKCVFKMSKGVNSVIKHEYTVSQDINKLNKYCRNFCRSIGIIQCEVDILSSKDSNPFSTTKNNKVVKDIILYEYIDGITLTKAIQSKTISKHGILSLLKQVVLALCIAQKKINFTHYDLHPENILVVKCDYNDTFLYVIDEDNQFVIPSHGYYPVIIDYGYTYTDSLNDTQFWNTMCLSDVGICPSQFSSIYDIIRFLTSTTNVIVKNRCDHDFRILKRIVMNIFYDIDNLNFKSGIITYDNHDTLSVLTRKLSSYNKISHVFSKYENHCIDILQSLVIQPFEEQTNCDLKISYQTFLNEWNKIENQVNVGVVNLYILKCIVDSAIKCRSYYYNVDTRNKSIVMFRRDVYSGVNKIISFCNLKELDFEKMLCSLYVLSLSLENVLYVIGTNCSKYEDYIKDTMEIKKTENFFCVLDINLPDDTYIYTTDTCLITYNILDETTNSSFMCEELSEDVNNIDTLSRGSYVYDYFKT